MNGFERTWRDEIIGNRAHFTIHSGLRPDRGLRRACSPRSTACPACVGASPYVDAEGMVRGEARRDRRRCACAASTRTRIGTGDRPARRTCCPAPSTRSTSLRAATTAAEQRRRAPTRHRRSAASSRGALGLARRRPARCSSRRSAGRRRRSARRRASSASASPASSSRASSSTTRCTPTRASPRRRTSARGRRGRRHRGAHHRLLPLARGRERRCSAALGSPYFTRDWKEFFPAFFQALKTERVMMFVLLTMIMVVAAFAIVVDARS